MQKDNIKPINRNFFLFFLILAVLSLLFLLNPIQSIFINKMGLSSAKSIKYYKFITVFALIACLIFLIFSFVALFWQNVISIIEKRNDFSFVSEKEKLKEVNILTVTFVIVVITSVLMLACVFMFPIMYGEIDSNALPLISLQYRFSFTVNQSDINHAKIDFPILYNGINSYDDLRNAKLIKIDDNNWLSYYFPAYPAACIPVKLVLQLLRMPQDRCFGLTNVLLVIIALLTIYKKLKSRAINKLLAVILLCFSPILLYVDYANYDVFIFALLTISLVNWYNGNKKLAALFLSIAGMSNSTIMAVGIVMIIDWLIEIIRENKRKGINVFVINNWKFAITYAVCFIPCLCPFILPSLVLGKQIFTGTAAIKGLLGRFLAYLFDINLGIFSFAPVQLLFFLILAVGIIIKKNPEGIVWLSFLIFTVASYSLMPHINCGMIYCARYVLWTYPIIALFIAFYSENLLRSIKSKGIVHGVSLGVTLLLFSFNLSNGMPYYDQMNNVASFILKYAPVLYNPLHSTFNSRVKHIDGGYEIIYPVCYYDDEGCLRKVLVDVSSAKNLAEILNGNEKDMYWLNKKLSKVNKEVYISVSSRRLLKNK